MTAEKQVKVYYVLGARPYQNIDVSPDKPAERKPGLKVNLMELTPEEAAEKARLSLQIDAELMQLDAELPRPEESEKVLRWERLYHQIHSKKLTPLLREYGAIDGSTQSFWVPRTGLKVGDILTEIPEDAVPKSPVKKPRKK